VPTALSRDRQEGVVMPDDDFGVSANEDRVTAVVSPRARGEPRLESAAPITADTVDRYLSDPNDVRAAEHELRKLGFTIAVAGPISISISGPRRLFEEVFGVRLQRRRTKVLGNHEVEYFEVAEGANRLLRPPENLRPLIEGVVLTRPPTLLQVGTLLTEGAVPPLAPPAPYHYFHVPSDVAGLLRAAPVHRLGHTGRGVRVGMIDTGLHPHPFYDFHGYRRDPVVLGAGESAPNSDFPFGHGTAVAANVFAIAPDVRLRMIKGYQDLPGALQLARNTSPPLHVLSISLAAYDADIPGATPDKLDPFYKLLRAR
jgi:hypothetical protein